MFDEHRHRKCIGNALFVPRLPETESPGVFRASVLRTSVEAARIRACRACAVCSFVATADGG